MNIKLYLDERKKRIDRRLKEILLSLKDTPEILKDAMSYSLIPGGKRIRPILTLACSEVVGGTDEDALDYACSIELIHTFSIIHDDLPAMDNDDYRRGKPTCHRVFGEGGAILAGDALIILAFETLTSANLTDKLTKMQYLHLITTVAHWIGPSGLTGGQMMDISRQSLFMDTDTLMDINLKKTGSLFYLACYGGAMLGGGSEEQVEALGEFGKKIGLAFQIVDDILDLSGNRANSGKEPFREIDASKTTFPVLIGIERSKELSERLSNEAIEHLKIFGEKAKMLKEIAKMLVHRDR